MNHSYYIPLNIYIYSIFLLLLLLFYITSIPSARNLSALVSDIPLIVNNAFFGAYATASTVKNPASFNFLISPDVIPPLFYIKLIINILVKHIYKQQRSNRLNY